MTEFEINYFNSKDVEQWCMRYIGPRMYYLHKQIGGQGWTIKGHLSPRPKVAIEDDKHALMAMIKFGA